MKRIFSVLLLLILVIAPMFPVFIVQVSSETDNRECFYFPTENDEALEGARNNKIQETSLDRNVELNSMIFTDTSSHEDEMYYVCRRGVDVVAFFGASVVKYVTAGNVFTLEFPRCKLDIPEGENPIGSVTYYLLGNDKNDWKLGVDDCFALRYSEIYPGIDLVYKVSSGKLKYEFLVAQKANPSLIGMKYPDA